MSLSMEGKSRPGTLQSDPTGSGHRLVASGDWTLVHYKRLFDEIRRYPDVTELDLGHLGRLDTAGVVLLSSILGVSRLRELADTSPALKKEQRALLIAVCEGLDKAQLTSHERRVSPIVAIVAYIGESVQAAWRNLIQFLGFVGWVLVTWARVAFRPGRWRMNAFFRQVQSTGLEAIPIVALLTFMVGAVVAFLGATVLGVFGASVYTIDLVAYSFMREFGVLLAAILMAGRTASAFTAQIGSMKVNEEIDAMRVQGFDPIEWLVLPRVLALLITLPLLAFVGVVAGLSGGGLVAIFALEVPLEQVLAIYREVPIRHFFMGMIKAPFFAFLIAVIGCLEGFKVGSSAESVGQHTTSSVVQCIFVVILVDALAALLFMEVGW